jgi:hypothetical protein
LIGKLKPLNLNRGLLPAAQKCGRSTLRGTGLPAENDVPEKMTVGKD